jgi:excisionase family DNA binding protein
VDKKLFTVTEAATILGISRSVLYLLLAESAIRSIKVGRSRRIPPAALDEFVANRVRQESSVLNR